MVHRTYKHLQASVSCAARTCAEYTKLFARVILLSTGLYRQRARRRMMRARRAVSNVLLRFGYTLLQYTNARQFAYATVRINKYWLHGSDPYSNQRD